MVGVLEIKACGLDPMTGYETRECAPVSAWLGAILYAWLLTPIVCVLNHSDFRGGPEASII
ncbi:hypothetical protein, partial [Thermoactinospora rubra]|uniref:hypothetical protein n=1 Tax=Thermoactinospora rubra TaxID=1088767 RepID=UPI00198030C8